MQSKPQTDGSVGFSCMHAHICFSWIFSGNATESVLPSLIVLWVCVTVCVVNAAMVSYNVIIGDTITKIAVRISGREFQFNDFMTSFIEKCFT